MVKRKRKRNERDGENNAQNKRKRSPKGKEITVTRMPVRNKREK